LYHYIQRPFAFRVEVPVLFHVVHDGANGYITEVRLREQVEVLTQAFGGVTVGCAHAALTLFHALFIIPYKFLSPVDPQLETTA
jgi:hypothetical protein